MSQTIRLDAWDSIETVRERLEEAESDSVLLVIPARCRAMRSLVNLKLLRRYAEDLRLGLRVVAEDVATRALAKEAGLRLGSPVWSLLGIGLSRRREAPYSRSPKGGWQRARGEEQGLLVAVTAVVVIMAVILTTLVVFMPHATVTLSPAMVPVSGSLEVTAEWGLEDVDYGRARVPARWVEIDVEGRHEIPTTGMEDVPEGRARGEVVFANRTSDPLVVPKGTFVRTGSGVNIRFLTLSDVELPGQLWAHARVGIVAIEPGPSGNVKALTINTVEGPLGFQVDALNDTPTTGGTIKRVFKVTTQDHVNLRDSLMQRLQQEAYNRLVEQLQEGEFIPPDSLRVEVTAEEFDQAVGERTDVLSGRMLVNVLGLAVDGQGADMLVRQLMEADAPDGYCLREDTLSFHSVGDTRVVAGSVEFARSGSGNAAPCVDEDQLKGMLRGRSLEEAGNYLIEQFDLSAPPIISVVPSVFGRMPLLSQRIEVAIEVGSDS